MSALGEDRFLREHECCSQTTVLTIQDAQGNIFDITMEKLFKMCKIQNYKNEMALLDTYLGDTYL